LADHVFEIACSVISSVDGGLKYTAHTEDVFNKDVRSAYEEYLNSGRKTKLHIVRLKKGAPRHKEPGLSDKIDDMVIYYSERALMKPLEWAVEFIAEE